MMSWVSSASGMKLSGMIRPFSGCAADQGFPSRGFAAGQVNLWLVMDHQLFYLIARLSWFPCYSGLLASPPRGSKNGTGCAPGPLARYMRRRPDDRVIGVAGLLGERWRLPMDNADADILLLDQVRLAH